MSIHVVLFADSHLGFDDPVRPTTQRRRRGDDFFANYLRVVDHVLSERPDLVVHGGDLFCRSRVPARVVDRAYEPLVSIAASGIPVVIVPGNHERSRLPESLWLGVPNLLVFREPSTFLFDCRGTSVAVSGFPFVRRVRDAFPDMLEQTGWHAASADVRVLCLHQTVEGATVGPKDHIFRSGNDVIPWRAIPAELPLVLAGHIHRRQVLTRSETRRVIYPGSIERTSFAEKNEVKGFYDLRIDTRPGFLESTRFVPLATRPMVDLELRASPDDVREEIASSVAEIDSEAVVRVRWPAVPIDVAQRTLTASFLRCTFPPTMNVQLPLELRRPRRAPDREPVS
ncbi:MAG: DNA repair exonuclease [Planctomycetes bacterium]|nr:DNA repair exonuclease [Planctomycetota bacterium]